MGPVNEGWLLSTKFLPPVMTRDVISVESFLQKMQEAAHHRLILVRAGAGYGKSTMLSAFFRRANLDCFWLTLSEEDTELALFLEDLVHAVRSGRPDAVSDAARILQESEDPHRSWRFVLNAWITAMHAMDGERIRLVIEDCHVVLGHGEVQLALEYLLRHSPPNLQVILTSRYPLSFLPVGEWRLKGHLFLLDEEDLAFDERAIALFMRSRCDRRLTRREAAAVVELTEGWPIAVEMIAGAVAEGEALEAVLADLRKGGGDLFRFLAADVLAILPTALRVFILRTAVLRTVGEEICTALFGPESRGYLEEAQQRGVLIQPLGRGNWGFHRLFRDFLLYTAQREAVDIAGLRIQAAAYYRGRGLLEEAVEYLLEGGAFMEAAQLIMQLGPSMMRQARHQTLLHWLEALPPETCSAHPATYLLKGDGRRAMSAFREALALYDEAERIYRGLGDQHGVAEALSRKALVFLDTVQPARAEPVLLQALQASEVLGPDACRPLLSLIAENLVNQGRLQQAGQIVDRLREHGTEQEVLVDARLQLRRGQLTQAIAFAQERLNNPDHAQDEQPKAHRELRLVLSLLYSLVGMRIPDAMEMAREVLFTSQRGDSRFTESVANSRLGHAHMVDGDLDRAIHYYREAARLSDNIRVKRAKGEPHWGLTLAFAYQGDEESCRFYADSGLAICMEANDHWLAALVRISRGIGLHVQGKYREALETLRLGRLALKQIGDEYGTTVGLFWEALTAWLLGGRELFATAAAELAAALRGRPYGFLLQRSHIWSPRDMGQVQRFLIACREEAQVDLGGPARSYHPGYTLNVRTMGEFGVFRGQERVAVQEWTRDKARRLFQLMLARRGQYSAREALIDILWTDKSRELGAKNLKVTLSTLNTILEPQRPEETAHFVVRSGDRYGLLDLDSIHLDADRFERLAKRGLSYLRQAMEEHAAEPLEQALAIYQGDFLEEAVYEEWVQVERERLRRLYLEAAQGLAQIYYNRGCYAECLVLCHQMLGRDACWEGAYRLAILCYGRSGEKAQAVQTYRRCKFVLQESLGVRPSQEIVATLKEAIRGL